MATAYIVAATPSSPEPKRIANLKSARTEADARAKLDRVDVAVTTVATGKLTYTAQGAPAPAPAAESDAAPDSDEAAPAADAIDMSGFEAALADVIGQDAESADESDEADEDAEDAEDAESDEDGSQEDAEGDSGDDEAPAADAAADAAADEPQADQSDAPAAASRGEADCGCSVDKIIATGEHGKGCADAPQVAAAVRSVERDRPARPARKGGARRASQGDAVVDGWELLYDKPRQKAQVGRRADGAYALICTDHKHAHPLTRLTQERGLRGGKRSVWCPECTN